MVACGVAAAVALIVSGKSRRLSGRRRAARPCGVGRLSPLGQQGRGALDGRVLLRVGHSACRGHRHRDPAQLIRGIGTTPKPRNPRCTEHVTTAPLARGAPHRAFNKRSTCANDRSSSALERQSRWPWRRCQSCLRREAARLSTCSGGHRATPSTRAPSRRCGRRSAKGRSSPSSLSTRRRRSPISSCLMACCNGRTLPISSWLPSAWRRCRSIPSAPLAGARRF